MWQGTIGVAGDDVWIGIADARVVRGHAVVARWVVWIGETFFAWTAASFTVRRARSIHTVFYMGKSRELGRPTLDIRAVSVRLVLDWFYCSGGNMESIVAYATKTPLFER